MDKFRNSLPTLTIGWLWGGELGRGEFGGGEFGLRGELAGDGEWGELSGIS